MSGSGIPLKVLVLTIVYSAISSNISLSPTLRALSNEYYRMLENPIVEKDRRNILNKFESFRTEVRELKKNRKDQTGNETRVLNSFIDKSSTNIQYLNDLAE